MWDQTRAFLIPILPPGDPAMPVFSINIDSFQITDTRSVHTDTNYASLSFSVGEDVKHQDTAWNMPQYGNYNNGTYPGNLVCAPLTIYPDSPLTFNYLMLNAGFTTQSKADSVLGNVGLKMLNGAPLPAGASCLQQVATEYASVFNTVLRLPGCDGLVAAEQVTFQYEDLASRLSGTPATFTHVTTHTGPKIAHSCNPSPSNYIVHWSVSEVVAVPDLIDMDGADAIKALNAVGLAGVANPKTGYVKAQSIQNGKLAALRTTIDLTLVSSRP
jgi:hypothetical protein